MSEVASGSSSSSSPTSHRDPSEGPASKNLRRIGKKYGQSQSGLDSGTTVSTSGSTETSSVDVKQDQPPVRSESKPYDAVGIIDFFNDTGGYGFIDSNATQEDVFFHREDIEETELAEGAKVGFDVVEADKGPRATSLTRYPDEAPQSVSAEEANAKNLLSDPTPRAESDFITEGYGKYCEYAAIRFIIVSVTVFLLEPFLREITLGIFVLLHFIHPPLGIFAAYLVYPFVVAIPGYIYAESGIIFLSAFLGGVAGLLPITQ